MTTLSDKIAEVERLISSATPGPWRWLCQNTLVSDNGRRPIVLTSESEILERGQDTLLGPMESDGPNAALIAAAPTLIREMLEVVKAAQEYAYHPGGLDPNNFSKMVSALEKFAGNEGGG